MRRQIYSVDRHSGVNRNFGGQEDRDSVRDVDLGGPEEPCIRLEPRSLAGNGAFGGRPAAMRFLVQVLRPLVLITYSQCSRVVSVLDSASEGPGFKSQSRCCRVSLRQTVLTHCSPSIKTGSSPLKGCGCNCRPGGK